MSSSRFWKFAAAGIIATNLLAAAPAHSEARYSLQKQTPLPSIVIPYFQSYPVAELAPLKKDLLFPQRFGEDNREQRAELFSQLEDVYLSGDFMLQQENPGDLHIIHANGRKYFLLGSEPVEGRGLAHLRTYNDYAGNFSVELQIRLSEDYEASIKNARERVLKEVLSQFFMEHRCFDALFIDVYYTDKAVSIEERCLRERMHIQFKTYFMTPAR